MWSSMYSVFGGTMSPRGDRSVCNPTNKPPRVFRDDPPGVPYEDYFADRMSEREDSSVFNRAYTPPPMFRDGSPHSPHQSPNQSPRTPPAGPGIFGVEAGHGQHNNSPPSPFLRSPQHSPLTRTEIIKKAVINYHDTDFVLKRNRACLKSDVHALFLQKNPNMEQHPNVFAKDFKAASGGRISSSRLIPAPTRADPPPTGNLLPQNKERVPHFVGVKPKREIRDLISYRTILPK